jgi:hypothetical protein
MESQMSEGQQNSSKRRRGRPAAKQNLLSHPLAHSLIKELLSRDATNEECAARLMCSVRTWCSYKAKHKDFLQTLMKEDELSDRDIEKSLYMTAKGYMKTTMKVEDGVTTIEEKWYPPSTQAQAFWLKNRQSQKWRDKIDIAASMEQIPVRINFKRKEKVIEAEGKVISEKSRESQIPDGQSTSPENGSQESVEDHEE